MPGRSPTRRVGGGLRRTSTGSSGEYRKARVGGESADNSAEVEQNRAPPVVRPRSRHNVALTAGRRQRKVGVGCNPAIAAATEDERCPARAAERLAIGALAD